MTALSKTVITWLMAELFSISSTFFNPTLFSLHCYFCHYTHNRHTWTYRSHRHVLYVVLCGCLSLCLFVCLFVFSPQVKFCSQSVSVWALHSIHIVSGTKTSVKTSMSWQRFCSMFGIFSKQLVFMYLTLSGNYSTRCTMHTVYRNSDYWSICSP